MNEPIVDPLAKMDQALAGMGDLAKIIRAFYLGLLSEGFTEQQALILTCHSQFVRGSQ